MTQGDHEHGEGNYRASREYNERTKRFVDVGPRGAGGARTRRRRTRRRPPSSRSAEEAGRRRAKEEDPQRSRPAGEAGAAAPRRASRVPARPAGHADHRPSRPTRRRRPAPGRKGASHALRDASPCSAPRLRPLAPSVPLLEAIDLPGDDDVWSLPDAFASDEAALDDDRYATLNVARAFDD